PFLLVKSVSAGNSLVALLRRCPALGWVLAGTGTPPASPTGTTSAPIARPVSPLPRLPVLLEAGDRLFPCDLYAQDRQIPPGFDELLPFVDAEVPLASRPVPDLYPPVRQMLYALDFVQVELGLPVALDLGALLVELDRDLQREDIAPVQACLRIP